MTNAERELAGVERRIEDHLKNADEILSKADAEDRDPTESEREEAQKEIKASRDLKDRKAELEETIAVQLEAKQFSKTMQAPKGDGVEVVGKSPAQVKSLGDQFIESKGYKDLLARGLSGNFSTGQIELATKGTLASSPGTALTPDERLGGVVETLYQPLTVADLLAQGTTNSSQITYVTETATSGVTAVAEQGLKPESTLSFSETTESVRKLATLLPVTDEMLEDAPQIQAYINQRLALFIRNAEENQILLGDGSAPNLAGIISPGNRTIGTYARGTVDDSALALFKAMNGTRGSSFLEPDAIVIHPTNWQAIRTAKDSNDQYYGGGPFFGPYGGPQGPAGSSQFSRDSLWGVQVVITSAITVGTALVGSFRQAAQLFRRSGISVEASNSHGTYFATNITAIRAEERIALAVYRPTAFTAVTGLE